VEEGAKISDLKITANSTSCTCVESGTDGVYDCCYKFSFSGFNRSLSYDATVTGLGTPVYFESSDTELGAVSVLYDYIYSDSVVGNVSSTAQETEGTFMYWYDTTDQRIVSFDKTLTKTYDIKDNTARDALGTMLKAGHTYRAVFESGGNGTVTVTLFDGISDTILADHKNSYRSSPEYAGFFLGYFNGATIKTNPYMTYDHETYSSYGYSTFDEYLSYIKSTYVLITDSTYSANCGYSIIQASGVTLNSDGSLTFVLQEWTGNNNSYTISLIYKYCVGGTWYTSSDESYFTNNAGTYLCDSATFTIDLPEGVTAVDIFAVESPQATASHYVNVDGPTTSYTMASEGTNTATSYFSKQSSTVGTYDATYSATEGRVFTMTFTDPDSIDLSNVTVTGAKSYSYDPDTGTYTVTVGTSDIAIIFDVNAYELKYDLNGGSAPDGSEDAFYTVTCDYGSNVTISSVVPERDGYEFTEWNTSSNGSGTSYASGKTINNLIAPITLYAQWSITTPITITADSKVYNGTVLTYTLNGSEAAGLVNGESVEGTVITTVSSSVGTYTVPETEFAVEFPETFDYANYDITYDVSLVIRSVPTPVTPDTPTVTYYDVTAIYDDEFVTVTGIPSSGEIAAGSSLTVTITGAVNVQSITVSVTMGGSSVSAFTYSEDVLNAGTVTIDSVSGDVVITVSYETVPTETLAEEAGFPWWILLVLLFALLLLIILLYKRRKDDEDEEEQFVA